MRNFLIIANPTAGKGKYLKPLGLLVDRLRREGYASEVYLTQENSYLSGELQRLIATILPTDITVIGGDGTVNQVVNSLNDQQIPLSILPIGTSNDFIKNLNPPKNIAQQIDRVIHGSLKRIDVGKCNGRIFLNGVGIGFDGKVVEYIDQHGKQFAGDMAYISTVLKLLLKYRAPMISYEVDGESGSGEIFMFTIANGTTFGGFKLTPNGKIDDGYLDTCFIPKLSKVARMVAVPIFQRGLQFELGLASHGLIKRMEVHQGDGAFAHLDGEFIGSPPFSIEIMEQKITFRQ